MELIDSIEATMPFFIPLCVFIFGVIWGSFLNVCIYRIPQGHSIVWPPSSCQCGKRIPFYFNIPVIAWFMLKGKAACCEEKLSFRYPLVEALTGTLFVFSWLNHQSIVAMVGMLFIAILIAATFIDLDHMIIPDIFSIGGMLLGVMVSIFIPQLHGFSQGGMEAHWYSWIESMLGIFVGTSMIYWIATIGEIILKKPAMGEGDVKFLAAIGAFTGWQGALFSLFGGAFIGTIIILPYLLIQQLKQPKEPKLQELPFGPFLAIGAIVYFLWLNNFVDAYFSQIVDIFTL
jgi:leader peptidase (prepilin peptidase)/N-methyltransferase